MLTNSTNSTNSTRSASRRDFWLIVGASLSWGTVGVANQAIYAHVATNALSLAFYRLLVAAPLFIVASLLLTRRRSFRVKPRDLGIMLLMGGMQALYQASYSAAIAYAGVTIPTLIALCAAPIMIALFSMCIARERLNVLTLLALVCALCGTILLVEARPHVSGGSVSLLGILFALLAAAGYAGFILCGRLLTGQYHPLHVNTVAFATGALLLLFVAVPGGLTLAYPLWAWLLLLYLGCIPTALAYGLFQIGMRSLSATVVSIVTLCEPLAAALLAWLLFHEELGLLGLLGAALLLGAMALILLFPGN
ncbi:MAG: EamA family transporter [Ktedonobacteraceae bacterium]